MIIWNLTEFEKQSIFSAMSANSFAISVELRNVFVVFRIVEHLCANFWFELALASKSTEYSQDV